MKKRFALDNFSKRSISNFIYKAGSIQSALSESMFSTITPAPSEVLPLINEMKQLANQTELGNYLCKARRDTVRQEIERMLTRQCFSVNALAAGDMIILLQSGFDINKVPTAVPLPNLPVIKTIALGSADNSVDVQIMGCRQARNYIIEIRDINNNLIREASSTRMMANVTGLPSGIMLRARVYAENASGRSLWTVYYSFMLNSIDGNMGLFTMTSTKSNQSAKDNSSAA